MVTRWLAGTLRVGGCGKREGWPNTDPRLVGYIAHSWACISAPDPDVELWLPTEHRPNPFGGKGDGWLWTEQCGLRFKTCGAMRRHEPLHSVSIDNAGLPYLRAGLEEAASRREFGSGASSPEYREPDSAVLLRRFPSGRRNQQEGFALFRVCHGFEDLPTHPRRCVMDRGAHQSGLGGMVCRSATGRGDTPPRLSRASTFGGIRC